MKGGEVRSSVGQFLVGLDLLMTVLFGLDVYLTTYVAVRDASDRLVDDRPAIIQHYRRCARPRPPPFPQDAAAESRTLFPVVFFISFLFHYHYPFCFIMIFF